MGDPKDNDAVQTELDRRAYYLSTLFDISKDVFGTLDTHSMLRNFLLMTMGNFGVTEGMVLIVDLVAGETEQFVATGFADKDLAELRKAAETLIFEGDFHALRRGEPDRIPPGRLPPGVTCFLPFMVDAHTAGVLGLGARIVSQPYEEEDRQLLETLVNGMVVALQNARSFEEVKRLNQDLLAKQAELEKTLAELRGAVKKVELLESIKSSLCKFVPSAVTQSMERSGTAAIPEAGVQDVSVLFLDVEGYTEISQQLSIAALNDVIERYFSVFLEAIYENNGDVNETAGDSLMVLFLNPDKQANALEAVKTALTIRERAGLIPAEMNELGRPLVINMGVNSGEALVGAARFESYTGSRWTYTARGMTSNLAARIGALASGGQILLSRATAQRVKKDYAVTSLGACSLKNVSRPTEVFSLEGLPDDRVRGNPAGTASSDKRDG